MIKKFEDVIHYVAYQTKDNPKDLGATKLNKILWYIDMYSFLNTGETLTSTKYIKQQRAPVPEWACLSQALDNLKRDNKVTISETEFYGHMKAHYVANTEPHGEFTEEQKKLMNEVIKLITKNYTASSISELSHDDIWYMAEVGEELPIRTCLVSKQGQVTEEMREWAKECVPS